MKKTVGRKKEKMNLKPKKMNNKMKIINNLKMIQIIFHIKNKIKINIQSINIKILNDR